MLRNEERNRMWRIRQHFYLNYDGKLREELIEFIDYMRKNWVSKMTGEYPNIWNFNHLARTRSTNPAEAYHSLLKKLVEIVNEKINVI